MVIVGFTESGDVVVNDPAGWGTLRCGASTTATRWKSCGSSIRAARSISFTREGRGSSFRL